VLVQYDTPDAILARPADDFVAQFVGEDRALRRLALHTVGEIALEPASPGEPGSRVSAGTTVRNAVSLMLETGTDQVVVVGDDGDELGLLRLHKAGELL